MEAYLESQTSFEDEESNLMKDFPTDDTSDVPPGKTSDKSRITPEPSKLLKLSNLSNFILSKACFSCNNHENEYGRPEEKFLANLIRRNMIEVSPSLIITSSIINDDCLQMEEDNGFCYEIGNHIESNEEIMEVESTFRLKVTNIVPISNSEFSDIFPITSDCEIISAPEEQIKTDDCPNLVENPRNEEVLQIDGLFHVTDFVLNNPPVLGPTEFYVQGNASDTLEDTNLSVSEEDYSNLVTKLYSSCTPSTSSTISNINSENCILSKEPEHIINDSEINSSIETTDDLPSFEEIVLKKEKKAPSSIMKKRTSSGLSLEEVLKDLKESEETKEKDKLVDALITSEDEPAIFHEKKSKLYKTLSDICEKNVLLIKEQDPIHSAFINIFNPSSALKLYAYPTIETMFGEALDHPYTAVERKLSKMSSSEFLNRLEENFPFSCKNKFLNKKNVFPLSLFLWRVMSFHDSESTVLRCQRTILMLLRKFHSRNFLSVCDLLVILINSGIIATQCTVPEKYVESLKELTSEIENLDLTTKRKLKSRPKAPKSEPGTSHSVSPKPKDVLLRNIGWVLDTLGSAIVLIGDNGISGETLSQIILIVIWLSFDQELFSSAQKPLGKCLIEALNRIPEDEWTERLQQLTDKLVSFTKNHQQIVYMVNLCPRTSRGSQLQKCISSNALPTFFNEDPSLFKNISCENLLNFLISHEVNKMEDYHKLHNLFYLAEICFGVDFQTNDKETLNALVEYLQKLSTCVKEEVMVEGRTVVRTLLVRLKSKMKIIAGLHPNANGKLF